MSWRHVLAFSVWLALSVSAAAQEIGYLEDFALAKDRSESLKLLIPGSEDHYYFSALHLQNTQKFDEVAKLLQPWIQRHGRTPRIIEIQLRQALLTYDKNPRESLDFIRGHLNLQFNHQRENLGEKPNLPNTLDPQVIDRDRLFADAIARFQNLDGFQDAALDWLVARQLDPNRRRILLQRLQRPDYSNLVQLVVDDLRHANSSGFGAFAIHRMLTKAQLDELLKLLPELLNQQHFVDTYLAKLAPHADVDWQRDDAEKEAYLDRLWSFALRLAPVHNSLKVHVLFHRLVLDRTRGLYDKQRFLAYLRLPRNAGYLAKSFVESDEARRFTADLNARFAPTGLAPIGNDEPLVRECFAHFFVDETDTKPYEPFVNDVFLRHILAETKIVNGLGNSEQWYSLLPPESYQALKERIDLDFAATNRRRFAADEPVAVDLFVKNVRTLIVKVFEINTRNYYRQNLREVNTDINLDGLVANEEQTHDYAEPPLRRVRRHFEFPSLARPGVYVIDFIGNGMSSRVVVRKGTLRHLVRTTPAGQLFTILDEQNQVVRDGTLWLSGREYTPVTTLLPGAASEHAAPQVQPAESRAGSDGGAAKAEPGNEGRVVGNEGGILVPFTDKPGPQSIVLSRGELSVLATFQHEAENYALAAGIHVDRESLLLRRPSEVVVRPSLTLNGIPVSLRTLEDVRLTISSVDHDGVATTKEVSPFPLYEDREATFDFQTPSRLASIAFTLTAKIQNLSRNQKINLSATQSFTLNSIDKTDKIEDLHLAKFDGKYVLELLGKSGEAKPDRPVQIELRHRDFRHGQVVTLKSDVRGRVQLGPLVDIVSIAATTPEGTRQEWPLGDDDHSQSSSVHAAVGSRVEIPIHVGRIDEKGPSRNVVSLLEVRNGSFVADHFEKLSIENGLLVAKGLPRGDFDLWLKRPNRHVTLRIAQGDERESYVLGSARQLEVRGAKPLHIGAISADADHVSIRLVNATKFARVHLFATRYVPKFDSFENLGRIVDAEPLRITPAAIEALYVSGRNIGDEYRYILDRRFAQKFPGVMLNRPSVLLNPWAVRSTQTSQQEAQAGQDFAPQSPPAPAMAARGGAAPADPQAVSVPVDSNLDFLADSSIVLTNLVPNDQGEIIVPRKDLGSHQDLHIVAVDPVSTASRSLSLPEAATKFRDLRVANGLDPAKHFTQQKRITILNPGDQLELADLATAKLETYDHLARVYGLFMTLSGGDAKLAEFGFVLGWPKLKPEEKRTLYSKYACHELNFFLFRRDPEFFTAVVKPYLANKRDRTFLDRWLLKLPVDEFLEPWHHERLNVVERILLSQRVAADHEYGTRHVRDLFDVLPSNVDRFNVYFGTAIRGRSLDTRLLDSQVADAISPTTWAAGPDEGTVMLGERGRYYAGGVPGAPGTASDKAGLVEERLVESEAKALAGERVEQLRAKLGRRVAGRSNQAGKDVDAFYAGVELRKSVRQLFQQLDKTQEWAENNYFKLPIEQQNGDLVPISGFWRDFAAHDAKKNKPFLSTHFAEASHNFTEMMFALALLDVPFEPAKHESKLEETTLRLTAASPIIAFHEEVRAAQTTDAKAPILISQNFFQANDRHRVVANEQVDKFVTEEFLVHTVYGCQVVVTNPTSTPRKLDVLTQIPVGAIAISGGEPTRGKHLELPPFATQTIEFFFYFPTAGEFAHFPVHVAKGEELLAAAEPVTLNVVEKLSRIDRESWEYVSQNGSDEQVLAFLRDANLQRVNLDKIAFRMADAKMFRLATELLSRRHAYSHVLWSYAIKHAVPAAVREFLRHADEFVGQTGDAIDSPILVVDPIARRTHQQLDYSPLVNARAHPLGRRRQILNDKFHEQYHRLLKVLGYRRELTDDDRLAVTYYLLLQDRIAEADGFFKQINAERLVTRLQYDYFAAYLALCHEDLDAAARIAATHAQHPVDRWRNAFASVASQVAEARSHGATPTETLDPMHRDQQQTQLAATEPTFDFTLDAKQITLHHQNLDRATVNFYLMDIELLFSRNPFVQTQSGQFAHIKPNLTQNIDLAKGKPTTPIALPEKLRNANVLVEITAGGQTKSQPYYANSLAVQLTENYGQARIVTANPGKPLLKVYVKVYARMKDGSVRFFKDGYTDLRGRFDYSSLNTNELDNVDRLALLILSEDHGAVVREAAPPKQ